MEIEELRLKKQNLYDTLYEFAMEGNIQAAKLWLEEHSHVDVNTNSGYGVILLPSIETEDGNNDVQV